MIVAFPEPRTPKEKSHPVFICSLGPLDTVYTVVICKNKFAFGQSLDYPKLCRTFAIICLRLNKSFCSDAMFAL